MIEGNVVELDSVISKSLSKLYNRGVEHLAIDARRKDHLPLLGGDCGIERVSRATDDLWQRGQ